MVKVVSIDPTPPSQRIGFMEGEIDVPDDFDAMFSAEIQAMFTSEK